MTEDEARLYRHTATRENGAAFRATREGGLARIHPLTFSASEWLNDHVGDDGDATWVGDDLILEMRYFPVFADAIMAAGFTFERDALPN